MLSIILFSIFEIRTKTITLDENQNLKLGGTYIARCRFV